MHTCSYGNAVREALHDEMLHNKNVVLMGQDIQSNVYGYTESLYDIFGAQRVINTPISEAAVLGTAVGSSLYGIIPIVDLTVASFLYISMDQIASIASKIRYMHNGKHNAQITILVWLLYGTSSASQHSDRPFSMIMNLPGIKSVAPASVQDAYSLIRSSVNDPDPVVVFLDRNLFYQKEVIIKSAAVKIGIPRLVKPGSMVTIVSISGAIKNSTIAVESLLSKGIDCELIDVRSLKPLDMSLIFESVKKTGFLVVNDLSSQVCSVAEHLIARCISQCFTHLKAPPLAFTYPDAHTPFSPYLESKLLANPEDIEEGILRLINN